LWKSGRLYRFLSQSGDPADLSTNNSNKLRLKFVVVCL
jgi:hypothetical protein